MSVYPLNGYAAGAGPVAPSPHAPSAVRINSPIDPGAVRIPDIAAPAASNNVVAGVAESARLDHAVDAINKFLKPVSSNIAFTIDHDSGRTVVQVIDTDTNDVIRQFPSKDALAISHELDKLQGLLLRDKA